MSLSYCLALDRVWLWICPLEKLWLIGYYQSVTTISKLMGFQMKARISICFGNTENSGIVSYTSSR